MPQPQVGNGTSGSNGAQPYLIEDKAPIFARDFNFNSGNGGDYNFNVLRDALLTANQNGGGTVIIDGSAVPYLLAGTPTIYDNTRLLGGGGRSTVIQNDSRLTAYRPMLVTPQVDPLTGLGRAGLAVTITSVGLIATLTRAAHGKKTGDYIGVAGATETGYIGVFRVESVPDANNLTYFCDEAPSASPATGTPLMWDATVNIAIEGICFDYNNTVLSGADANTRHAIITAHCFNPQFVNLRMENVSKYAIYPVNSKDLFAERIEFQTASDGLHAVGASVATVRHLSGYCGDDFVPFLTDEGSGSQYNLGTWAKFPFRGIHLSKLYPRNGLQSCVKLGGNAHPYRDVTIDNCAGQANGNYITVIEDPAAFAHIGAPNIDVLKISNCRPVGFSATGALLNIASNTDNTSGIIKRLQLTDSGYVGSSNQKLLFLGGSGSGSYTVNDLILDNIDVDPTIQSAVGGGISVNNKGIIGTLHLKRCRNTGVNANFKWLQNDGAISRIYIDEQTMPNGNGFLMQISSSGSGNTDIHIVNSNTQCTNNPFDLRHSSGRTVNIFSQNWRHQNSAPISINGTGTTNLYGELLSASALAIAGGPAAVTNQLNNWAQTIAFAAAVTPDLALGTVVTIAALTGTITINNPTAANMPRAGTEVTFMFADGGNVANVVTWGTNYKFAVAWSTVGQAAAQKSQITFRSNGTQLIAQGQNSWYA